MSDLLKVVRLPLLSSEIIRTLSENTHFALNAKIAVIILISYYLIKIKVPYHI